MIFISERDDHIKQALIRRYSKNIDIEINEDTKTFKLKNTSEEDMIWLKNKLKNNPQGIKLLYKIDKYATLILENNQFVLSF